MDVTEKIQNAIEWANKRLTLQGQELSQEQKDYLSFALSQNLTEQTQSLQLHKTNVSGSALRKRFYKETNIAPVFAQRTPYIQYIEFLEKELTR